MATSIRNRLSHALERRLGVGATSTSTGESGASESTYKKHHIETSGATLAANDFNIPGTGQQTWFVVIKQDMCIFKAAQLSDLQTKDKFNFIHNYKLHVYA